MGHDKLKARIRELGHLLAYEEEVGHRFKDWYSRKTEHDKLLRKLYRTENKV
jgi:hypothetical protein